MKRIVSMFLFCLIGVAFAQAQQTDPAKLQSAVDSKTFTFEARQASAMKGRMIQLDPGYTLEVNAEKVKGDLPFFGRSYQSTPGTTDGGLKFEFSEFNYTAKPRKKGGWDITIEPAEANDIRSIFLTIQKTGNASLRIVSNSKEGMSYNGIIKD